MTEQASSTGLAVDGMPAWQLARRQRIVDAALKALEQQEYEQIQIRDVAASAGVALGTLYRYFSSKEHLYAAVLDTWAAVERAGGRTSRTPRSPEERVRARMHAVIRAFERQPQFYKVHVLLQTSADPNAKVLLAEFADASRQALARELDVLSEQDADDAAIMLWSIISTMVTQAVYYGGSMAEVHRMIDRFVDLLAPQLHD